MKILKIAVVEPSPVVTEGLKSVFSGHCGIFRHFDDKNPESLKKELVSFRPTLLLLNEWYLGIETPRFVRDVTEKTRTAVIGITYGGNRNSCECYKDSVSIFDPPDKIVGSAMNALEKRNEPETGELSERETDIVRYVVRGMSNKEIADRLHLSIHTVHTHRKNIANKLNIRSSSGLTIYAILNNIIRLEEVQL